MKYTKSQLKDALKYADLDDVPFHDPVYRRLERAGKFSGTDNAVAILAAAYRDQTAMVEQLKAEIEAIKSKPNHLGA